MIVLPFRLPTRRRNTSAVVLAAVLAVVAALAPGAAAAQDRTFGSVRVSCAEDKFCVAAVRAVDGQGGTLSVLQLARTPQPRSRWTIAISTLASLADRTRPVSLAVDGKVGITLRPESDYAPFINPGDFYVLAPSALDRLMVDLQVGSQLRFTYIDIAGGPHTDQFPLDGLTAALTEIDRAQGRVVGDRRAGPPVDLPRAPEIDRQAMVALAGIPPRLTEWHLQSSTCEAPDSAALAGIEPVIGPLSPTAVLYAMPCFVRAGRPNHRLYYVENGEIGGMHTLFFATWSARFGWSGAETLESVVYDREARRLTAVDTGGVEGCGSAGSWVWDAYAFRLESMRAPTRCDDGSDPAAWPAVPGSP